MKTSMKASMTTSTKHISTVLMALALALSATAAGAQAHTEQFGPYTLRSSTVSSLELAPSTAHAHGIERAPNVAVLNVTILRNEQTVPGAVTASARDLTGNTRTIVLRETVNDNFVSYTGSYRFVHGEVLDLIINAEPQGAGETLVMRYRERMWADGDLTDQAPLR